MSDIAEDDSVEKEWKKKKEKQDGVKILDPQVQKQSLKVGIKEGSKDEGKQSLHSQMAGKVGATDCIIVVGTTGLGKSTCVNLYTGQVNNHDDHDHDHDDDNDGESNSCISCTTTWRVSESL